LIRHLLLHANRLVVVVEGYGATFRNTTRREYPVLHSYMSTQVRLYRIVSKSEGLLQLVSTKNLNGQFMEAQVVKENVHIIMHMGIDTYTNLIGPFELHNPTYTGMTTQQYVVVIKMVAKTEAIHSFVDSLISKLGYLL